MKTYSDLTKEEKEKIKMYFMLTYDDKILFAVLTLIMYIGGFIGIALIFMPSFLLTSAGTVIVLISLYVSFLTLKKMEEHKKMSKLIFDFEDVVEDVFKITKEDKQKIKKKWVKINGK